MQIFKRESIDKEKQVNGWTLFLFICSELVLIGLIILLVGLFLMKTLHKDSIPFFRDEVYPHTLVVFAFYGFNTALYYIYKNKVIKEKYDIIQAVRNGTVNPFDVLRNKKILQTKEKNIVAQLDILKFFFPTTTIAFIMKILSEGVTLSELLKNSYSLLIIYTVVLCCIHILFLLRHRSYILDNISIIECYEFLNSDKK